MPNEITITSLEITSRNGTYAYDGGSGSFNTAGESLLRSISGIKPGVGTFEAYTEDNGWNYNPHFTDLSKAAELIEFMSNAIVGVQSSLEQIA